MKKRKLQCYVVLMKRFTAVAMSMVLLAGLIGCSDSDNEVAELTPEDEAKGWVIDYYSEVGFSSIWEELDIQSLSAKEFTSECFIEDHVDSFISLNLFEMGDATDSNKWQRWKEVTISEPPNWEGGLVYEDIFLNLACLETKLSGGDYGRIQTSLRENCDSNGGMYCLLFNLER